MEKRREKEKGRREVPIEEKKNEDRF